MVDFTKILEVNLTKEEITQFIVRSVVNLRADLEPGVEFNITFEYGSTDYDGPGRASDVLTGAKILFK